MADEWDAGDLPAGVRARRSPGAGGWWSASRSTGDEDVARRRLRHRPGDAPAGRAAAARHRARRSTARPGWSRRPRASWPTWARGCACARPTCASWRSSAPVDLIVSTATFHWILDHERLFARLLAALAPGGRLVAQCGGAGNIAATLRGRRRGRGPRPLRRGTCADMPDELALRRRTWPRSRACASAGLRRTPTRGSRRPRPTSTTPGRARSSSPPWCCATTSSGCPSDLRAPLRARRRRRGCREPDGRVEIDYVRLNLQARRPEPEPRSSAPRTAPRSSAGTRRS